MFRPAKPLLILVVGLMALLEFAPALAATRAPAAPVPVSFGADQTADLPKPAVSVTTVWSAVNWDAEVVLLPALEETARGRRVLLDAGRNAEAAALSPERVSLSDERALEYYRVPGDIRALVREYRKSAAGLMGEARTRRLEALQSEIKARTAPGRAAPSPVMQDLSADAGAMIDVGSASQLKGLQLIGGREARLLKEGVSVRLNAPGTADRHPLLRVTLPAIQKAQRQSTADRENQDAAGRVSWYDRAVSYVKGLFIAAPVLADDPTPIMAYYAGIEERTMDYILYHLAQTQNADGSFGAYNQYELTGNVVLLLSEFGRTASGQYSLALNYLKTATPQNNREKALKARLMYGLGEPYQAILDELASEQNAENGGWGLTPGYESDVLTTLEVVIAYAVSNYGVSDKLPAGLAYVSNRIGSDGAMHYTPGSQPSYYLMSETLRYLAPFADYTVSDGVNQVSIQSKIDAILNFLKAHYDEAAGTLDYSSGLGDKLAVLDALQTYDTAPGKQQALWDETIEQQSGDGSFGDSLYDTILALRSFPEPDLEITTVTPNGQLANYAPLSLTFTVKNVGYAPSGQSFIYSFVDKVRIGDSIDCLANGLVLEPNAVGTLTAGYSTDSFIGDTNFLFYVEGAEDADHGNDWHETTLAFAGGQNGQPALPMYYIAQQYDNGGAPGLNVRWATKSDPNRLNYVIMFRPQGTSGWSYYGISNSWNGAFLTGAFAEGAVYEVTAGVLHQDGATVTYFTNPTSVKVTGSETLYRGGATGQVTLDSGPTADVSTWGYSVSDRADAAGVVEYANVPNGTTAIRAYEYHLDSLWTRIAVPVSATTTGARIFTRLKPDTAPPVVDGFEIRYKSNLIVKNKKEVELFVWGSDDVAIKEAAFYLWDPAESAWQFLGAYAMQNSYQALFPWYVPEGLLGSGYKVKAVLRDYQGNLSAEKEWGPFTVIDGAPPAFAFTSPVGGENLALGSEAAITWATQAVNNVSKVSLYLLREDGYVMQNKSDISNTGSYLWKLPAEANFAGENMRWRILGSDDVNYETGQTESASFNLVDVSAQPPAPWGSVTIPFASTAYTPAGGDIQRAELAVGSDGRLHALYRYTHDIIAEPRIFTEQLYYAVRSLSGEWGNPELVYEKVWTTDYSFTGVRSIYDFKFALDASDRPHIVWQDSSSGGCSGFNSQEIWYRSFSGAAWSEPLSLSANETESLFPDFSLDSQGQVHVAWLDGLVWDGNCNASGSHTLRYRVRSETGNWSGTETLSPDPYPGEPQITATSDGTVHLVSGLGSLSETGYLRRVNGVWSAPVSIAPVYPNWPELEKGATSTWHYVYRQYYSDPVTGVGRSRLMYVFFNGTDWLPAVEVTPNSGGYTGEYPALAVDAANNPQILYENNTNLPTGSERSVKWVTRNADGLWTSPVPASRPSQYVGSDSLRAAYVKNTEELAVVWASGYNYSQQLHFNRADLNGPPAISGLSSYPSVLAAGETQVTVTATFNDAGSNILKAEYYYTNSVGASSTPAAMSPVDGAYDSQLETVRAVVDTSMWTTAAGPYTIFVRARDATGKWSEYTALDIKVPTGNTMYGVGLGHWQFDELDWKGTKGEVLDVSGSNNHATATGGSLTTTTPEVAPGRVAYLDGIDDGIATLIPYTNGTDLTVSAWYKMMSPVPSRLALVGGTNGGRFEAYVDNGKPGCRVWDTADRSIFADEPAVGGWHQVTCVQVYGANPSTKLYVDGVLKKTVPYASVSAGGYWHIGKPGSSGAKNYQGLIDQTMIYGAALSAAQVAEQFTLQKGIYGTVTEPVSAVVGYWKFDDAVWSGAKGEVKDSSLLGSHGTAGGGANTTTTLSLADNRAGAFDGVDDYVATPVSYSGQTPVSVSAWYATENTSASRMALVGGNNGGRFEVYVHQGRPGCRVWDTADRSIYTDEIYAGSWHQVTCVQVYGANPSTKLYVDGVLKKTVPYASVSAGGYWHIGKAGSGSATPYQGLADEVAVRHETLTAEAVANLYAAQKSLFPAPSSPSILAALWKFNEPAWTGAKGEVKDSSGKASHATAFGGVTTAASPDISGAAGFFDGVNDYVGTAVAYGGTDTSLSAWYMTTNTLTNRLALLGGTNGGRFEVYVHQGRPGCRIWNGGERSIYADDIFAGDWHHVVCVQVYGANPSTKLYVDGVLKKSAPYSSLPAGGWWSIGRPGSSIAKHFIGYIDEVAVYSEALSEAKVAELFAEGR